VISGKKLFISADSLKWDAKVSKQFFSEIFLTILRGWKWTVVQSVTDVTSLNFAVQTGILFFSFALTATDISTIYFEVSWRQNFLERIFFLRGEMKNVFLMP
jgi:hypothetical protein